MDQPDRGGRPAAIGRSTLHEGPAEDAYGRWDAPDLIVSDGAYGIGGFAGDPGTPDGLELWYANHVAAWSRHAKPATTLWLWNTEIGWATVHPLLRSYGWDYVQTVVWDKGIQHVASNVNGRTIRRLPTVTEVCAFYRRALRIEGPEKWIAVQQWLRTEWFRARLPLRLANEACGVRDAATRKYLTLSPLWYLPPPETVVRLVAYANAHGDPAGRPYYAPDGRTPVTEADWARLRHPWRHQHSLTNVWSHPPLGNRERYRPGNAPEDGRSGARGRNQKPLTLMQRIIDAVTDPGDTVWEPFGGLCSASVAAIQTGRHAFAAEPNRQCWALARKRLAEVQANGEPQRC